MSSHKLNLKIFKKPTNLLMSRLFFKNDQNVKKVGKTKKTLIIDVSYVLRTCFYQKEIYFKHNFLEKNKHTF